MSYQHDEHRELANKVEAAYQASGNRLGWRLLYSPPAVLNSANVAFIGLNPGGSERPADHAEFAMTSGSAYTDEAWGGHAAGQSPLQRQVAAVFQKIGVSPDAVLAGNFVPFRSSSWDTLHDSQGALAFARVLWTEILQQARPSVVIAMGNIPRAEIAKILAIKTTDKFSTGWEKTTASRGSDGETTFIGLPHLSRFRLMNRQASIQHMDAIFQDVMTN